MPRLPTIDTAKATARHDLCSDPEQLGRLSHSVADDIANAAPAGNLEGEQQDELIEPPITPQWLTCVVFFREFVEFMSRNQFQKLREDCVRISHGLDS